MEAVAMLKLRAPGSTRSGCKLLQCKNELTQPADGVDEGVGGNGGVVVPGKKYTSDCSQYGIGFKLDTDGWVDGWLMQRRDR